MIEYKAPFGRIVPLNGLSSAFIGRELMWLPEQRLLVYVKRDRRWLPHNGAQFDLLELERFLDGVRALTPDDLTFVGGPQMSFEVRSPRVRGEIRSQPWGLKLTVNNEPVEEEDLYVNSRRHMERLSAKVSKKTASDGERAALDMHRRLNDNGDPGNPDPTQEKGEDTPDRVDSAPKRVPDSGDGDERTVGSAAGVAARKAASLSKLAAILGGKGNSDEGDNH